MSGPPPVTVTVAVPGLSGNDPLLGGQLEGDRRVAPAGDGEFGAVERRPPAGPALGQRQVAVALGGAEVLPRQGDRRSGDRAGWIGPVITGGGSGAGAGLPCWLVVTPSERPELT